ncbi:hypothetical protein K9M59_01125 [Candidatus Gracilibacteria bacterium]|nr:hypothetical protein [Candidatus Gracilibacteria bacterium]MCF7819170.1 hypothetical protein [Candidatus Gracilibacteria bacterium]
MKYAFLKRNFQKLSFEERTVFLVHALTILFCFFPWISIQPLYDDPYWHSALSGPGFLIGTFVLILSVLVVLFYLDKILESNRIKTKVPDTHIFLTAGIEQLILLVLAWSVLISISREFESSEIRFGIFAAFLAQVVGVVSAYLHLQNQQKKRARDFFQHPKAPQKNESEGDTESSEKEDIGGLFAENNTDKK